MQDKHFSQTFENKANVYDAEYLCLQNGLVFRDADSLTDPSEIAGVNREWDLPACMDGIAGSPFLPFQELYSDSTSIPLLRWGVSSWELVCHILGVHLQRRFLHSG